MSQTATLKQKLIGLALSGGGMRAAAFHAGVLKYLAEQNLLENVAHISSVSGGSLFTGLVFRLGQYKWPTSNEYIKNVLPNIGQIFTSKSLQCQTFRKWISHWYNLRLVGLILVLLYLDCVNSNIALVAVVIVLITISYRFRYTKSNALSQVISRSWDIKATLSQLPDFPVWSINATSTETGRRFRFKGIEIGDYETQYTNAPQFLLAKAMAISASVPFVLGPMRFKTSQLVWKKSKKRPVIDKDDPSSFTCLHLYDGGIYDNLGMEPLFDAGEQTIKAFNQKINYLLFSDGGAIFEKKPKRFFIKDITLYRIIHIIVDKITPYRIMNIIMDQVHGLRI